MLATLTNMHTLARKMLQFSLSMIKLLHNDQNYLSDLTSKVICERLDKESSSHLTGHAIEPPHPIGTAFCMLNYNKTQSHFKYLTKTVICLQTEQANTVV